MNDRAHGGSPGGRLGRSRRDAVSGPAEPGAARLRTELHPIRVAYETYGALSPQRDNVILVCHALSGDAHAAGFSEEAAKQSTRDGFGADDRDGTRR